MRQNHFETSLYSSVGVAAMFVVVMALYIVLSEAKVRFDVTADRAHTLSPGTKRILGKIKSPVTIRFYCTQGDNAMPPALRRYAQQIDDLLSEYQQAAAGKIVIQKLDVKPDSDAEDSARLNGVEGQATGPYGANKIYLGLVVSVFGEKFALPWLSPDRERLLEYDISRALSHVIKGTPPVIGIMSAFPAFGLPVNPLAMRRDEHDNEPWVFVSELQKDFTVKQVPMTVSSIDPNIRILLVVHPRNISAATQYALDQFVLRGGKLFAFLDPHAFFDESNDQQNRVFQVVGSNAYGQSTLGLLLKAWGLTMDMDTVVADMSYGSRNTKTGDMNPAILLIGRSGIDQNNAITSQMDNLALPFAGAFVGKAAEGLQETVLVKSSPNSQLVDTLISAAASEQIQRDFKPGNVALPLVVHLAGTFKTAFPDGNPRGPDPGQLKKSIGAGEVVLVADTDMLNDRVCVRVRNVMGHRRFTPMNGNLNFVQGVVEYFAGDDDLVSARSRASTSRPFTRLKDLQAQAGRQWEEKIRALETRQREMERMINELQTHRDGGEVEKVILSPEQETELENYQETRVQISRDLKEVRRHLRKDTDALEFWTKVINIGAMPLAVAASGLVVAGVKLNRRRALKR